MMQLSPRDKTRRWMWLAGERAFGLDAVLIEKDTAPRTNIVSQTTSPDAVSRRASTSGLGYSGSKGPPLPSPAFLPLNETKPEIFPVTSITPVLSSAPFTSPILRPEKKIAALSLLDSTEVKGCTKCRLSETRNKTVFGEGDPNAHIFFIGEGPGENEDLQGRPFVGRAGELLNKMIQGMGLKREQVFIANIVKCRPPNNRVPAPDEVETCTPYLVQQLEIIRPKVVITLGLPSAKYMLGSKMPMGKLRGRWHDWRGIKLMPTFHPAYLLRVYTEENRAMVWSDLKKVMAEVGLPTPEKPAR